jgi:aromatic ring-opening dioxygenase catalytic subunit (LigB family)
MVKPVYAVLLAALWIISNHPTEEHPLPLYLALGAAGENAGG